jgi:hypothetical protein
MKMTLYILFAGLFLYSCNGSAKPETNSATAGKDSAENQKFFPVTAYLKGEIYNIKKNGINPLKYTSVNNHTDSAWLKIDEIDAAVQEFLQPQIDSSGLTEMFTEKSFFDQSINAVTFTYEPISSLPDSMKLRRWDVYIDPQSDKVKRIYLVKEMDKTKMLQLTWVSGQWCKIVSIITDEKGISKIEKEEKLVWDFTK